MFLRSWFSEAAVHKIDVLKNFAVQEPFSNKIAGLLLQSAYDRCFWILTAAKTFLQRNLVFIADSRTFFCSGLLWKHELNLRSSHWSCSVKKFVLRNFANFTGKHLCWSLFLVKLQTFRPATLLKRDSKTDVFLWILGKF